MHQFIDADWSEILTDVTLAFLNRSEEVRGTHWHAQDISDNPMLVSWELMNTTIHLYQMPSTPAAARYVLNPNLPWAEDHFQERVGGQPLNPAPSEAWWPFAVAGNAAHKDGEQFSHTYPERMWPKFANEGNTRPNGRHVFVPHNGIRYEYGDLRDLIELLARDLLTRQAYLPIWFPEDTGAANGQRVPCTLGYHFLIRNGQLNLTYHIRSCDFVRHFVDDVYMAVRLAQWVADQVDADIKMGSFTMHIGSFHFFEGDRAKLKEMAG